MEPEGRRGARPAQVKNKAPAPIQITAEQIIREAQDRQAQDPKPPRQKITDEEEMKMYRFVDSKFRHYSNQFQGCESERNLKIQFVAIGQI